MSIQGYFYLQSYEKWCEAITGRCNIRLTPDCTRSRVLALKDPSEQSTKEFAERYGEAYLQQVILWFE